VRSAKYLAVVFVSLFLFYAPETLRSAYYIAYAQSVRAHKLEKGQTDLIKFGIGELYDKSFEIFGFLYT
jgi:hypothetical protein